MSIDRDRTKILPFYGGYFSQWHPCEIKLFGMDFTCAEQIMMFAKASLFRDDSAIYGIMNTDNPYDQKVIGRLVHNFNADNWNRYAKDVVLFANFTKFTQNIILKDYLVATKDYWLVEASPSDRIWGVGLGETHDDILNPDKWMGTNYLGECIMEARDVILNPEEYQDENGRIILPARHTDVYEVCFEYGRKLMENIPCV